MKWKLYIVGVLILILASCRKAWTEREEDKLVGSWKFENVTYKKNFFTAGENQTWMYQDWVWSFYEQGDFRAMNLESGEETSGVWDLYLYQSYDETTSSYYTLTISTVDASGRINQMVLKIDHLSRNKLKVSEELVKGYRSYRLTRY